MEASKPSDIDSCWFRLMVWFRPPLDQTHTQEGKRKSEYNDLCKLRKFLFMTRLAVSTSQMWHAFADGLIELVFVFFQ